ncbi:uncharacterized protein BXZ73DRAFT_95488 [Epithele typhae]|uniref:uncharacterized protein n=1 Tax=Epithele typhae TaxID=378194 RepID=UPI002008C95D|nr:uncharacterized protein BXZ73DRAFT_95488 [Epithele typhae]KAH9945972.1 hypothetical protein BXZ73DRAFT_95488 [Epithele typhae]
MDAFDAAQSPAPILLLRLLCPAEIADRVRSKSSTISQYLLLALHLVLYAALALLLSVHALLEDATTPLHDGLCRLLALPPCTVHPPRESAVVIIGADDGQSPRVSHTLAELLDRPRVLALALGRHIALSFSQRGFTVFALCADKPAAPPAPADASSNVSSSSEWHQRIKKASGAPGAPWGLVAPIVLDMGSRTQRARACETVDAYCSTHRLTLAAVVVLPLPFPHAPPFGPDGLAAGPDSARPMTLGDAVRAGVELPAALVDDYAGLLAGSSGRVVVPLTSSWPEHEQQQPRASTSVALHASTLRATARLLGEALAPRGVHVVTVDVARGPSTPRSAFKPESSDPASALDSLPAAASAAAVEEEATTSGAGREPIDSPTQRFGARTDAVGRAGFTSAIRGTIEDVLSRFAPRKEDVFQAVHTIVRSRYPRERYAVGARAVLQHACAALPLPLRLCARAAALHAFW